jgi:hypothetical protein
MITVSVLSKSTLHFLTDCNFNKNCIYFNNMYNNVSVGVIYFLILLIRLNLKNKLKNYIKFL